MTTTPRTAAKYAEVYAGDDYEAVEKLNEFAQQLERELNEAKERIKRLEKAGDAIETFAKDYKFWFLEDFRKESLKLWKKAKESKP